MKKNLKYTLIALFPIALYASEQPEDLNKTNANLYIQDCGEKKECNNTSKSIEKIKTNYPLGLTLNGDCGYDYALNSLSKDCAEPQNNLSEPEKSYSYDKLFFKELEERYSNHVDNSVWNTWRTMLMNIARIDTNVYLLNEEAICCGKSNSIYTAENALSNGEAKYYRDFKIEALLILSNKKPLCIGASKQKKSQLDKEKEHEYNEMLAEAQDFACSELNKMSAIITYKNYYATKVIKALNTRSNNLEKNPVLCLIRDMAKDTEHHNVMWALSELRDFKDPENQKILESTTEIIASNRHHKDAAKAGIFLHNHGSQEKKEHA